MTKDELGMGLTGTKMRRGWGYNKEEEVCWDKRRWRFTGTTKMVGGKLTVTKEEWRGGGGGGGHTFAKEEGGVPEAVIFVTIA